MEYWEFLLQKEGDRSWLPLESPDVEILEGRYRAVARTSRANCDVEIRIIHLSTDEAPPKRRVQKQVRRTNGEGLMVVFPFTRLQPGIWELQCVPDLMSGLLGNDWQQSVRLQVLTAESEPDGDWQPDWQLSPEAAPDHSSTERLQELTSQGQVPEEAEVSESTRVVEVSHAVVDEDVALPAIVAAHVELETADVAQPNSLTIETQLNDQVHPKRELETLEKTSLAEMMPEEMGISSPGIVSWPLEQQTIRLNLPSESFMAYWGQSFNLAGQVELQWFSKEQEPLTVESLTWMAELQICLRDPQTLQVLATAFQLLPITYPTTPFSCAIEIPEACPTRLLLGEISLFTAEAEAEPSLTPLVTQPFTVTAALDELLGALTASQPPAEESQSTDPFADPPEMEEALKPASRLNLALLDLVKAPAQPQAPVQFKPAPKSPLPPQIYRPTVDRPTQKSPQLPVIRKVESQNFASVQNAVQEASLPQMELPTDPEEVTQLLECVSSILNGPAATELIADLLNSVMLPVQQEESAVVEESPVVEESSAEATLAPVDPVAEPVASLEEPSEESELTELGALHPLNLQERFFSRLNALASDEELSEQLRFALGIVPEAEPEESDDEDDAEIVSSDVSDSPEPVEREPDADLILDHHLLETVVAEDEWIAREIVIDDEFLPVDDIQPEQVPESAVLVMMADAEPLPVPELEVPLGELVAEKAVNVRVRLPGHISRAYVKLWLNDRQTLSLLAGPWSLHSFTPDGTGQLEATTLIRIPPGSLEIQFEAITVELHSQRQSRKAICSRMVVPANLPVFAMSDFEEI